MCHKHFIIFQQKVNINLDCFVIDCLLSLYLLAKRIIIKTNDFFKIMLIPADGGKECYGSKRIFIGNLTHTE